MTPDESATAVALGAAAVVWLSDRRAGAALVLVVFLAVLLPVIDSTFEALNLVVVLVVFRAVMTTKLQPPCSPPRASRPSR